MSGISDDLLAWLAQAATAPEPASGRCCERSDAAAQAKLGKELSKWGLERHD